MASFAILDRESDLEMANPAEQTIVDCVHAEVLRAFFLDIEDVRMAIGAVKPLGVFLMREYCFRFNQVPFRFKPQGFVKGDWFEILDVKTLFGFDLLIA